MHVDATFLFTQFHLNSELQRKNRPQDLDGSLKLQPFGTPGQVSEERTCFSYRDRDIKGTEIRTKQKHEDIEVNSDD